MMNQKPKKYDSVAEMLNDVSEDQKFAEDVTRRLEQREVIKQLIALRCKENKSQGDIAKHMSCSQSKISKLESGTDEELSIGDLAMYLDALGKSTRIVVLDKNCTAADEVKYHTHSIQRILGEVTELAQGSDIKGVVGLIRELALTIGRTIRNTAAQLCLPSRISVGPQVAIDVEDNPDDATCGNCGSVS